MKKLMSIGEVSKIKNISVKSLRYYADIGILPPAYVNPQSGYRYYSIEQLFILDLISICLELDIPLKQFKNYLNTQGEVDIGNLLIDGQKIAAEKMRKLQSSVHLLEAISKHIQHSEELKQKKAKRIEVKPKRFFLTMAWNGDITDYKTISTNYTKLYKQSKTLNLGDSFNQGIIYIYKDATIQANVFIEISQYYSGIDNLLVIEESLFECQRLNVKELLQYAEKSFTQTTIIKELIELNVNPQQIQVEVEKQLS